MADVCVVHLVRAGNPPEQLEAFAASYREHDAGLEHELVLLLKGAAAEAELAGARVVRVPDDGFDIDAYLAAARVLDHRRVCFLNSHSRIRCDGWLALLDAPFSDPRTGVAGASGSWASRSSHVRFDAGLGGPYRQALGDRDAARRAFTGLSGAAPPPGNALTRRLRVAKTLAHEWRAFPAFPNAHLRTNAFLIDRELLLRLRIAPSASKEDAYRAESGRESVTRQVQRSDRRAVLVGRRGAAASWRGSGIYCDGEQENLLVADNQTDVYASAAPPLRRVLAAYAWGTSA
jgi:hypothetical protein